MAVGPGLMLCLIAGIVTDNDQICQYKSAKKRYIRQHRKFFQKSPRICANTHIVVLSVLPNQLQYPKVSVKAGWHYITMEEGRLWLKKW